MCTMFEQFPYPSPGDIFNSLELPPFAYNDAARRYPNTDNNDAEQLLQGARADLHHYAPLKEYPEMRLVKVFHTSVRFSVFVSCVLSCANVS